MSIPIDWNGQKKTTIPHPSVPAFRLLCEQYGIRSKWNDRDKKLELEKDDLKGKKVCFITHSEKEHQIFTKVKHFLSETGIEVQLISNKTSLPRQRDVYLQCSIQNTKISQKPEATLLTPAKTFQKKFVSSLQKELQDIGMITRIHRSIEKHTSSSFVHIHLNLPDMEETFQQLKEPLAIGFASAILRYFQEKHPMTLLSSLSPELRQVFMNIIPNLHSESEQKTSTRTEHPMNTEIETAENQVETTTIIQKPFAKTVSLPQQEIKKAEVFFDYSLILSDKEEEKWIILGNLYIKNTGTQDLRNPQIILQVTPSRALNIGGQILPPNCVDTLGVQSSGETQGWKYLDENWLKMGKEKGEYRIGSIQPLQILPGETETHSLQISFIQSSVEGAVFVTGHVYFEEQEYQCTANNRISLSF